MAKIIVFDTTLRDGEQSPGASMTPAEKLRMAHELEELEVDVIEAGFPISSDDDFSGVRKIAKDVRGPAIAALARASDGDIDRAAEAIEGAQRPRLHVFIATSDIHLEHKLQIGREECLERAAAAVTRARRLCDDVEFSAEDATRTDLAFLCDVVRAAVNAGAGTINVPDTVGYAHPAELRTILTTLRAEVAGLEDCVLSVHCHDDLGLAVANSLAALEVGARQVECTINGIGERAGNAALEEIVMALEVRQDLTEYYTTVKTDHLYRTSQLLAHLTGIHPQPNKAIVGKNAFAHEAGIHQHGMLQNPMTYEIMTPEMVGVPASELVLGKHSGRHALEHRCKELGYEMDAEELARAYHLFTLLAEQKKQVLDEDLLAILHHGAWHDAEHVHHLHSLEVTCGEARATARVRLSCHKDPERDATAEGDGPIAAVFSAIDAAVDARVHIEDLQIRSATPGRDAVGEVTIQATVDGRTFTGRGASTDVVNAAARAYLNALDKAAQADEHEARELERTSYLWGV